MHESQGKISATERNPQVRPHIKCLPISVIVPVYNAGEFLSQCVESINAGTPPAEILLVDDCSTDNSLEVALSLSEKHPNVRILKSEKNAGAAYARKRAILASSQDLVALVDADDFLEDGAIQDAYDRLDGDVDLVIWELWKYELDGAQHRTAANPDRFPIRGDDAMLQSLAGWRIHPLGIARKDVYLQAYEDFVVESYNSDELITRLVFKGCRSITGSGKKYFYRTNPKSTTQTVSDRHLTGLRSHVWLIRLCLMTKNAPTSSVIMGGVYAAYSFFKKRRDYGKGRLNEELFRFVSSCIRIPEVWRTLLLSPKYLGAFVIISLYSLHKNAVFSQKENVK